MTAVSKTLWLVARKRSFPHASVWYNVTTHCDYIIACEINVPHRYTLTLVSYIFIPTVTRRLLIHILLSFICVSAKTRSIAGTFFLYMCVSSCFENLINAAGNSSRFISLLILTNAGKFHVMVVTVCVLTWVLYWYTCCVTYTC